MSRKLTLHGKTVEVSDEDADSLMHLGAEIGIALTNTVFNGEAAKQMRGPQRGHAPRLAQEHVVAKNKAAAAEQLHDVVQRMREMRGQK